jgi:2-oxoglutarate ferredoxin oxidoreductase subunit beta
MGSVDRPFNPLAFALGAGATFVARTLDVDMKHMVATMSAAMDHRGTSFVEIYQNCNIFNDGAFAALKEKGQKEHNQIRLNAGAPIVFGPEGEHAVVSDADGTMRIVPTEEAGDRVVVHDPARDKTTSAFALSRLSTNPTGPTPIGVFRAVDRPVYDDELRGQVAAATEQKGPGDLAGLLASGNVWDVL